MQPTHTGRSHNKKLAILKSQIQIRRRNNLSTSLTQDLSKNEYVWKIGNKVTDDDDSDDDNDDDDEENCSCIFKNSGLIQKCRKTNTFS